MRRNQKNKLSLKKETIVNLAVQEMRNVHGGAELQGQVVAETKAKTCYFITMSPCSTATMWNTCENCYIILNTID